MDSAFMLDQEDRNSFIQHLVHTFGCTYICLWLYWPLPSNCLTFFDGLCQKDDDNRPSTSSTGSLALTLFQEYKASAFNLVENGGVPGLAFKNNVPYLELKKMDLRRLASLATQSQFYQVARIKTAIFMGCKSGEVELGFSNEPQINTEKELRAWFPEDFSRPHCLPPPPKQLLPQPTTPRKRPSSSSTSSLRSVSLDSPDNSSLLFNINQMNPPAKILKEATGPIGQVLQQPTTNTTTTTNTATPSHHLHAFRFPAQVSEAPAWTQAVLATKSFSPLPPPPLYGYSRRTGAFIEYKYSKAVQMKTGSGSRLERQSTLKRVMAFLRSLRGLQLTRTNQSQQMPHASRPTTTKLHHMISERKRREKLNESFLALRSLLPPGIKRDKASVLGSAREYLGSLKAQVLELTRENEKLEAQVLRGKQATSTAAGSSDGGDDFGAGGASEERLGVQTENVASSMTSEERRVNLRVSLRGEASLSDLATQVLDFLKRVENVSLLSMEAESTPMEELGHLHRVIFRLRVEGQDWDETSFREAVRRVVAEVVRRQVTGPPNTHGRVVRDGGSPTC